MRGILIQTKGTEIPWGKLNPEKITYKMTLMEEKTGEIYSTNFSRSCAPKQSPKKESAKLAHTL